MENSLIHDPAPFEMLDDDPFEKLGCDTSVPDAGRVDNHDRPARTDTQTWRLPALDSRRTKQQSLSLKQ